jgi:hypothetical protein
MQLSSLARMEDATSFEGVSLAMPVAVERDKMTKSLEAASLNTDFKREYNVWDDSVSRLVCGRERVPRPSK